MTYAVCPACGHFHAVTATFDATDAQIVALVRARFAPGERLHIRTIAAHERVMLSDSAVLRRVRALADAGVFERVQTSARYGWYRVPGDSAAQTGREGRAQGSERESDDYANRERREDGTKTLIQAVTCVV